MIKAELLSTNLIHENLFIKKKKKIYNFKKKTCFKLGNRLELAEWIIVEFSLAYP